jgi:hypothetical protein
MDDDSMNSGRSVFGEIIDQCPECSHVWTDDAECHYHDCRYFALDQEMEAEVCEFEDELRWGQLTQFKPAA